MNNNYPHLSSDAIVDSVLNFLVTGDSNKEPTAEELRIKELARQALEENQAVLIPLFRSLHELLTLEHTEVNDVNEKLGQVKAGLVEIIESLLVEGSSRIVKSEMGIN